MADYFFRDDMEAEKDRQAQNPTLTLSAPAAPAPAAPTAPKPAASPYAAIGAAAAPQGQENPFDAFRAALDAQDPFRAQVKQSVADTLANPAAAADEAAGLSRDRLAKSQQVEAERRRQQAGLAYGGAQTGQVGRAMDDYATEAALETQDHEGQLRAERAAAIERNRNAAIGQGTTILGQEEQARQAAAQLAQNERMQDKQIASTEKMTYAGLELNRDQFEAADANAKKGLSLEESAQQLTKLGMDREEAFRYAELAQQKNIADQEVASREKLAMAQIGSAERLEASRQVFQGEQAKMDRELQKLLSNDRIQAEFQLADINNAFAEKMQANGFVQEKDIEAMRADLQTRLQERGIAADVAKQISDQKFAELMAGRDQAFEEKMTNLKQSWASGERSATQDWESAMQAGEMQHQELMSKLESTLRLGEAKNAQEFQTAFQQMQNDFTLYRDQLGYSHEDAMRLSQEAFQERMQAAGFTHDEAMQGSQLAWQANENQKSRASQEMMAAASLAQQDSQFMQELQQRYQFNDQDMELRKQELGAQLQLMGLQGEQLKAALANDKVQNAMQIAALGMEIGDGSEGAMAPFVEQLGAALEGYMKGQGIDVSGSDFVKAMTTKTGTTGATGSAPGSADALQDAKDTLDDIMGRLPAKVDRAAVSAQLDKITTGANYSGEEWLSMGGQPGFASQVKTSYVPGTGRATVLSTTPEAKDFLGFYKLTQMGIPEKDAATLVIKAIGDARFKAAYKALTGKDWI